MIVDSSVAEAMLRVSENTRNIPETWTWGRLEDLCKGVYDCPHSTPKLTATGPYVVRTQDILSGFFLAASAGHVSEETYRERTARAVPRRGDLLYSREGTYFGIAAAVPSGMKVCLGQRMVLIRPDETAIEFRFLRYWLNSPIMASYIHGFRDGSVAERLNLPTIRSLPVLIPSMREQSAISDVLAALDEKIAANDRIGEAGEHLALAIAADERWPKRVPLGSIVSCVRNQVSPDSLSADVVAHYSLPAFDEDRLPELVHPGTIKSGKFLVDGSAVLLSKLNPATPRIWSVKPKPSMPALASTEFLVLKTVEGVAPDEVWAVSKQPTFIGDLVGMATGTSNSHQRIRPSDLLATEVVDPRSMPESDRETIIAIAERSRQARLETKTLACFRDTLLPKLMSGEIRVRDVEKVVEDVT
jgi:type I restriction enzyme, S subunit